MKSLWSDSTALEIVENYTNRGFSRDLALRVYTTRLLGSDPRLVLHGGGNTSVKTTDTDLLGNEINVLCVKGSGWDMGVIEPEGLPTVRLDPLLALQNLQSLSDEEMVNVQRSNLLDSTAPNPSVETLLHAFLPHKFVDHTHSTAILSLVDQTDSVAICKKVFGKTMGIVPYKMPGFALAKLAAEVYQQDPSVEGLILLQHGIFTFANSAKESYQRMINMVTLAEDYITQNVVHQHETINLPNELASVADIAPVIRGICCLKDNDSVSRFVIDFRTDEQILNFVNGKELLRYSQIGVVTPDHSIRTKNLPLIVAAPEKNNLEAFALNLQNALTSYCEDYQSYFLRQNAESADPKVQLDPLPRLILVPGIGLFGLGKSAKDAAIAADIAQNMVSVISDAEKIGKFQSISEKDLFEIEYWSLEQAKLGKNKEQTLARHVVVITGGGSGIGAATAKRFAEQGAEIALLDINEADAKAIANSIGKFAMGIQCDVTNTESVEYAFKQILEQFGGVDIIVSNAGAAWQGEIGTVDDAILRSSFELNFWAHQRVAQAAVKIFKQQNFGGCLLFNTSKQAVNPGKDFGPYGLPKAATLSLMKQYAVDHGKEGIRSNAVNADRIRSGLVTNEMITQRSQAREVTEEEYMSGNLLQKEVLAEDVAKAFVDLALSPKTTGAILTVDGGNIAASLR